MLLKQSYEQLSLIYTKAISSHGHDLAQLVKTTNLYLPHPKIILNLISSKQLLMKIITLQMVQN